VTFREPDEQEEDKTETEPMMSDAIVYTYGTQYASTYCLFLLTPLYIHTIYTPKVEGALKMEHLT